MLKPHSVYSRLAFVLTTTFVLSSCSFDGIDKSTTFNKNLDSPSDHTQEKPSPNKSAPPSPVPSLVQANPVPKPEPGVAPATPVAAPATPVAAPATPAAKPVLPKNPLAPAPVAPPAVTSAPSSTGDFVGNYVSTDSDLEINSSKDVVIHTLAFSALSAEKYNQKLCKIDREGTIQSIDTEGSNPAIHFNITSEKFSAVQAGSADANFCAEIGKSFSEPHAFIAPIEGTGNGYLALNLEETSSDGVSVTTTTGSLSGLFFDRDSPTNLTHAILQVLPTNFVGAFGGGFIPSLPVSRLTFNLDLKSETFTLIDNECAFFIAGPLNVTGSSNSILLTAPRNSMTIATLTNAAEKTYSVYFGRLSGGCKQRKQNFISQLTGSGIKLEDAAEPGKYALDFSATGGANSKYTIRSN